MKLATLKARSVRGIPRDWPDLTIGERGLVVYGPNGVGKSSIVDALEYGIRAVSSVYPVARQGVTWDNGASHVRGGEPDISIEVTSKSGSFSLSPDIEQDGITDGDRAWITTARNATFVLRRHMLLRFITAEPRERYGQLEPFMNLGAYQGVENALKDCKDSLSTQHLAAQTTVAERAAPLRGTFGLDAGTPVIEANFLERLNTVLRALDLADVMTMVQLKTRQAEIAAELGGREQSQRLSVLGALLTEGQHLGRAGDLTELVGALTAALQDWEQEIEARTDAVLTDLLVRGKEAIEATGLESCPVCEQKIDRDAVMARLEERIAADERITTARQRVDENRAALMEHAQLMSQAMTRFVEHWGQHVATPLPEAYTTTLTLVVELEAALREDPSTSARMRDFLPRLEAAVHDHAGIIAMVDGLIAAEGGGERRGRLIKALGMIEALLTDWPALQAAVAQADVVDGKKAVITRLHSHAVDARKAAVGAILDDVAERANAFYELIHPGEGIANSRLEVREVGSGSLNLATEFHGNREHPMLHYSESHLDTLGLCYFLALRKQEALKAPEFKIIVLDDVMHSVDADHRSRIAALIKREFGDHQVIVTTHDLYFFEALRRTLGADNYTYGRINAWDLERGPVFGDPLTDYPRIMIPEQREKLGEEELSAAGGRFFEWLLREVTELLAVAVPARFSRGPDIGLLWPPLASRLKRQKGYAAEHQKLIEALEENMWVRNKCGAHYEPAPAPPTPNEVRAFAEALAALHDTLFCAECGDFVGRAGNRDWRCRDGHVVYPEKTEAPKSNPTCA